MVRELSTSTPQTRRYGGVACGPMRPDELERLLCERLDALVPTPRAELLRVFTLPDFDRVGAIQSYWANP
jgi:hypothetical protein